MQLLYNIITYIMQLLYNIIILYNYIIYYNYCNGL